RAGGAPLTPAERALAAGVADALAQLVASERQAAELRQTRELLGRADRLAALGMLAAGVAHEIRNPLVSVRTFIQLLPERLADEEFRTGFRELALGEIERICALINDLLAFSRPAPAERERTDLNELVAQIARLLEAEARRRDVAVSFHGEPDLPQVVVDEAQVKQVLMNLLLNALQACCARGRSMPTRSEARPPVVLPPLTAAAAAAVLAPPRLPAEVTSVPLACRAAAGTIPVLLRAPAAAGRLLLARALHALAGREGSLVVATGRRPPLDRVPAGSALYLDVAALAPDGALALEALLDDARVWVLAGADPGAELPRPLGARLPAVVLAVPPLAPRARELPALAPAVLAGRGRRPAIAPPRPPAPAR